VGAHPGGTCRRGPAAGLELFPGQHPAAEPAHSTPLPGCRPSHLSGQVVLYVPAAADQGCPAKQRRPPRPLLPPAGGTAVAAAAASVAAVGCKLVACAAAPAAACRLLAAGQQGCRGRGKAATVPFREAACTPSGSGSFDRGIRRRPKRTGAQEEGESPCCFALSTSRAGRIDGAGTGRTPSLPSLHTH